MLIHVCLSPYVSAALGSRLAMSARVLCHMDTSDSVIYMSQKAQTVPGHGKVTPVGIPCVRPQSDMRCYQLDRCDLESGSRQTGDERILGKCEEFSIGVFMW